MELTARWLSWTGQRMKGEEVEFNPFKTKRNLFYKRTQLLPLSKHSPPRV
jgi:hypothetical protein